MSSSLESKAISGIAWSAVDKISARIIQFLLSIVIARILMPSDYGIIGMVVIFTTLSNLLIDSGFSQALVQKQDRTQIDFSTAFYFNITIAVVCYILIYILSPFVASFYEMPILRDVLRVLSLGLLLNSLCTVQRAIFLIKIDFRSLALINILSIIISGTIGVYLAYKNYGVWALVSQTLVSQLITTILLWLKSDWRPSRNFSKLSISGLWRFGSKLLIAGTISTIVREINSIVIGKYYKATELGYYHRAVQTADLVSNTTNEVINAVTFPVLTSVQDDKERLVSIYKKMLSITALFIFPIMTGLALVAEPLVRILLTDKWLPAVPLIQWLCFARVFTPISSINMSILNAIGRSDLFLKIDLSKIPIIFVIMLITLPIGVKAVVIGSVISSFICYFINTYYPCKLFGYGVCKQIKDLYKIIVNTLIMSVCVYLSSLITDHNIFKLFTQAIVGFVAYITGAYVLKIKDLNYIIKIVLCKIKHNDR